LRREAIAQMTRTPDVIVFGGSRFELATPDLFPGDFLQRVRPQRRVREPRRLSGLLYEHKRCEKPRADRPFQDFLPDRPALRETDEFQLFWSEYRSMADRSDRKNPCSTSFPGLLVASAVGGQHRKHVSYGSMESGKVPSNRRPGRHGRHSAAARWLLERTQCLLRTISVVARRDQHFSNADTIDRNSEQRAAKMSKRALAGRSQAPDALGVLSRSSRKQGTHVTIAITPFTRVLEKQHGLALRNSLVS